MIPLTMLERETESIIRILTEQTIGTAHSLALKDALAADIPRSITTYLHCEVAHLMQEDLRSGIHFSKLPSSIPVVQRLTKVYTHALALECILTRDEFVAMLENGVHFVENYLCRPEWTLEQFVFEKEQRVTFGELQRKLGYVCEYLYLGRLVEGYMQQRGWNEIGIDEFRSLVARIDDRVVGQHTPAELAQLTRPIYEFLLLRTDIRNTSIPLSALTVFFEDKRMKALAEYIGKICHIRSADQLTIEQLATIIGDFGPDPGEPAPPSEEADANTPSHPEPVPASDPVTPPPPTPTTEGPAPEIDKRNVALSLTYSGMTETSRPASPPSPLPDLREAIAPDQRTRFIRTIFQEDDSYYNVVIETLNDMKTWNDASLYLQTFFQTSGIDPRLPEAIEFSDLVQLRYLTQQQS